MLDCTPRSEESSGLDQPLLQAFKTELEKLCKAERLAAEQEVKKEPHSSNTSAEVSVMNEVMPADIDTGKILVDSAKSLISGVGSLISELQKQIAEAQACTMQRSENSDIQFESLPSAVLNGVDRCIRTAATSCQQASDATKSAAEKARGVDLRAFGSTAKSLQDLLGRFRALSHSLLHDVPAVQSDAQGLVECENPSAPSSDDGPEYILILQNVNDAFSVDEHVLY